MEFRIHNKQLGMVTVKLSDEDRDLAARPWHLAGGKPGKGGPGWYACGADGYLHRIVAKRAGLLVIARRQIDHANGNKLDNRRSNLRLADRSQNMANADSRRGTSQFKGVSWSVAAQAWQVHIGASGRSYGLGLYESEEDAAHAYDIAAVRVFGDFARLNFPERIGEPPPVRFSAKTKPRAAVAVPARVPVVMDSKARVGAGNGRAKLTESDVRVIITELQAVPRRSQASIAVQFGVSEQAIGRIARRQSWRHLWE